MADYIDRQAAIAALRKFAEDCKGSTEAATAAVMAISVISRLPNPWVSVGDVFPPGGKDVLLAIGKTDVFTGYYIGGRYYDGECREACGVTHWMPLPDALEAEKCGS